MTLLDFKDLEAYQNDFIMYIHFNMVSIHHITPDVRPGRTGIQNFTNVDNAEFTINFIKFVHYIKVTKRLQNLTT